MSLQIFQIRCGKWSTLKFFTLEAPGVQRCVLLYLKYSKYNTWGMDLTDI